MAKQLGREGEGQRQELFGAVAYCRCGSRQQAARQPARGAANLNSNLNCLALVLLAAMPSFSQFLAKFC